MLLRVFLLIWGAIFVTLVSFGLFIHAMNWLTPPFARNAMTMELAEAALRGLVREYGADDAIARWQVLAPVFAPTTLVPDPGCTGEPRFTDGGGNCLVLTQPEGPPPLVAELRGLALPLLFGAVISAFAALLVSRRMARDYAILNSGLQRLSSGRFNTRIIPELQPRDAHMRRLALAFDDAASQLQSLSEGRQRLFHDISHEIRSPLARLQAAIALLEKHPQRYETMLGQMGTDIGRLDHLVDEILTLARLEQDDPVLVRENLDLVDLLEPIIADANFEGQRRKITVVYDGPDHLPMSGTAELLHRSFENVIRNALTHSPDGGMVRVAVQQESSGARIDILDSGPGVAPEELGLLFTPFVRVGDTARSKGAGLGLAIAARGIELHGGTIIASNRIEGGLQVTQHLP